jgi:5,5'-dehydrodivanillate O-demethylase oxygenase subunit
MVTTDENALLTRIGPGTRMGALMRRYWHVVAVRSEMTDRWTKRVRLLGENLVLYKDLNGGFGLIGEFCPHRRASLAYGIPTENGMRCMYHGWEFNGQGECIDQPFESRHALKGKKATAGYPVEELGGLLFAYLGPAPVPLLPRLEALVAGGAIRHVSRQEIPCNWLQIMENSADPVHTEWLHGKLTEFLTKTPLPIGRRHARIAIDEFEYGLVKRRLMEGQSEDADDWKVGHPILFPSVLFFGSAGGLWKALHLQIRVPVDDTTTAHYWYAAYFPPDDAEVPAAMLENVPLYGFPVKDETGEYLLQYIDNQDIMAWATQGPIADRPEENLGASDQGVVAYRRMLLRELDRMERGEDPLGVLRDPAKNEVIELPLERHKEMQSDGFAKNFRRNTGIFSPYARDLLSIFEHGRPAAPNEAATEPAAAK